jgi:hypothetical protein
MTETQFTDFWRELNDWMIVYGEDEVPLGDARHLFDMFDGNAEAASDHEARIRRLDKQADLQQNPKYCHPT